MQWLSAQSHEEAIKICFEPTVIVCKKGDGFSYLNQVAGADCFVQNPNWSEAYGKDGGFEPNREMKVCSRLDINGSGKRVGPMPYFTLPGEYNGFR